MTGLMDITNTAYLLKCLIIVEISFFFFLEVLRQRYDRFDGSDPDVLIFRDESEDIDVM